MAACELRRVAALTVLERIAYRTLGTLKCKDPGTRAAIRCACPRGADGQAQHPRNRRAYVRTASQANA
eukprot:11249863-Alexandrium_andersonii.AAC.1